MSGITASTGQSMAPDQQSKELPMGSYFPLNFTQLQLAACALVLASSGLVPIEELGTAMFASFYAVVLSREVFPRRTKQKPPPLLGSHSLLPLVSAVGSIVGLFLPLAYVFGGFTQGDQKAVSAATPQLFLLACQMLTESVMVQVDWITLPVRIIITLLYTARRLVVINAWVRDVFAENPFSLDIPLWELFGRALALANGGFWATSLVCFVIPVLLPRAFEKHYEMEHGSRQGGPADKAKSESHSTDTKSKNGKTSWWPSMTGGKTKAI